MNRCIDCGAEHNRDHAKRCVPCEAEREFWFWQRWEIRTAGIAFYSSPVVIRMERDRAA